MALLPQKKPGLLPVDEEQLTLGETPLGLTSEGRLGYPNNFGGFSTEYTMTIQLPDGRFVVAPSIYGGKILEPDQVRQIIMANGLRDPETNLPLRTFSSPEEAEPYARGRSSGIQFVPFSRMTPQGSNEPGV